MTHEEIVAYVRSVAEPLLAARDIELVELTGRPQGRQHCLQLLVHTPGGISLDRCAELNRALSGALDQAALLTEPYLLEVSSPGLDRPLTTRRDFERVTGETVTIDLHEPLAGARQVVGRVVSANDSSVALETQRWGTVALPTANIANAVLTLPW